MYETKVWLATIPTIVPSALMDDQALDSDPGQRQRPGNRSAEETAERVREFNERIIEASNRGGHVYLDAYERTLKSIADFEERVAGASQVEWISAVANSQANFTREIAEASPRPDESSSSRTLV